MGCSPAPAAKAALAEATTRWPHRSKVSDGICPSAAHSAQNPTSYHETGDAFDLTHDPVNGVDCNALAQRMPNDPRTDEVIWNRRIWTRRRASEGWRPYSGSNPHTKHMHVSINRDARGSSASWFGLVLKNTPAPAGQPRRINMLIVEFDLDGDPAVFLAFANGDLLHLGDGSDVKNLEAIGIPHVHLGPVTGERWKALKAA